MSAGTSRPASAQTIPASAAARASRSPGGPTRREGRLPRGPHRRQRALDAGEQLELQHRLVDEQVQAPTSTRPGEAATDAASGVGHGS